MKTPAGLGFPSDWFRVVMMAVAGLMLAAVDARGQLPFRVGSIVTTNITMQNRFRWTNDNGQVFSPSNSAIRLSDFDGKIAFFTFFDVW